jgi:DNA-binding PadR family transcriptional regulator
MSYIGKHAYHPLIIKGRMYMSLKNAILGLLSAKPQTGYDIKTNFDHSIGFVWNSDQTQIYKTLSEMIQENLVSLTVVHQDGKPSKKVYEITDAGMEQLKHWLLKPLKQKNQRNHELLQFFFLGHLSNEEILTNLERMKQGIEMNLTALSTVQQSSELFDQNEEAYRVNFFFKKALELGIMNAKMNVEWITGVIHEIEEGGLGNGVYKR